MLKLCFNSKRLAFCGCDSVLDLSKTRLAICSCVRSLHLFAANQFTHNSLVIGHHKRHGNQNVSGTGPGAAPPPMRPNCLLTTLPTKSGGCSPRSLSTLSNSSTHPPLKARPFKSSRPLYALWSSCQPCPPPLLNNDRCMYHTALVTCCSRCGLVESPLSPSPQYRLQDTR